MRSTERRSRAGLSLVELMIALSLFSLLGLAVWSNVYVHGQSFLFNRVSNANVLNASFVLNRLTYGNADFWGLRTASRSLSSVEATGVVTADGIAGWRAEFGQSVEDEDLPEVLENRVQVVTYHPQTRRIDVDGRVVGRRVADSYLRIEGGEVLLGVQVVNERGGDDAMLETRIRMRNF